MRNIAGIATLLAIFSCAPEKQKGEGGTGQVIDSLVVDNEVISYTERDSVQDDLARFLAGIPQNRANSPYLAFEKEVFWKNYRNRIDISWKKLNANRLKLIRNWDSSFFKFYKADTLPLFYPFSGPDFLHAYVLYPKVSTYILLALESIQDLPAIDRLNRDSQRIYLESIEGALEDVFHKSYFITTHMMEDLKTQKAKGVLPLFYFFMARCGLEVRKTEQITLDTAGVIVPVKSFQRGQMKGIRIIFRDGEKEKTLIYFSCNIADKGIKQTPELMKFLKETGMVNTFIKSASYMPHYSTFSIIRKHSLKYSQSIFEDDTGIPFKYLKRNADFETILMGEYAKPVKDFGPWVFQKDLDSAFHDTTAVRHIPFHLGYHWNDKKQAFLLSRRKIKP